MTCKTVSLSIILNTPRCFHKTVQFCLEIFCKRHTEKTQKLKDITTRDKHIQEVCFLQVSWYDSMCAFPRTPDGAYILNVRSGSVHEIDLTLVECELYLTMNTDIIICKSILAIWASKVALFSSAHNVSRSVQKLVCYEHSK